MVKQQASADTEVEWQLDALDLRPAERWFGALPPNATPLNTHCA